MIVFIQIWLGSYVLHFTYNMVRAQKRQLYNCLHCFFMKCTFQTFVLFYIDIHWSAIAPKSQTERVWPQHFFSTHTHTHTSTHLCLFLQWAVKLHRTENNSLSEWRIYPTLSRSVQTCSCELTWRQNASPDTKAIHCGPHESEDTGLKASLLSTHVGDSQSKLSYIV